MPTPTTATFDLADWTSRFSEIAEVGAASIEDSLPYLEVSPGVFVDQGRLVALADGDESSALATVRFPMRQHSGDYTLELSLSSLGDYPVVGSGSAVFLRVASAQDSATGLLLTSSGIFAATSVDDEDKVLLLDTREALYTSYKVVRETTTLRLTFDASSGVLTLYAALSGDGYDDDPDQLSAVRLATFVAKPSTFAASMLDIIVRAAPGSIQAIALTALRLSSAAVVPPLLPTCQVQGPSQGAVGSAPRFYAEASDPVGLPLTYEWDILGYPEGAHPRMGAGANSTVDIGTEDDGNFIRIYARRQSASLNGWTFVLVAGASDAPLAVSVNHVEKTVTYTLSYDSGITTIAAELLAAINSEVAAGGNTFVSQTFYAESVDAASVLNGVVPEGSYTLSGGAASVAEAPVLLADVPGLYTIQARVSNGVVWSPPSAYTYLAVHSSQLLGAKPNSQYFFKYIGSFWNGVANTEHLPTLWSALTQVVSGELVKYLEAEAAGYIQEISSREQWRWVKYSLERDVEDVRLSSTGEGTWQATPSYTLSGGLSQFSLELSTRAPSVSVGDYLVIKQDTVAPQVVRVLAATSQLKFKVTPYEGAVLLNTGSRLRVVPDPLTPLVTDESVLLRDPAFTRFSGYPGSFVLKLGSEQYPVSSLSSTGDIRIGTLLPVGAEYKAWELYAVPASCSVEKLPVLVYGAGTVLPGDSVQISYTLPDIDETLELWTSVLYSGTEAFVPDWAPLQALVGQATAQSVTPTEAATRYHSCDTVISRADCVSGIAPLSVPRAGYLPDELELRQGKDFDVVDGALTLLPLCVAKGTVANDKLQLTSPLQSTLVDDTSTLLTQLVGRTIYFGRGVGFAVIKSAAAGLLVLDRALGTTGFLEGVVYAHAAAAERQPNLWAELSFTSAAQTISNNFGLLVGLPYEEYDPNADPSKYLSAVRGIHYSLITGPTLKNIEHALGCMLGAPAVLTSTTVASIREPDALAEGFIVTVADDGTAFVHPYVEGSEIAVNPSTGNRYSASIPGLPAELQGDAHADAIVAPMTNVVRLARVDDYTTDPEAVHAALAPDRQLARHHTFLVRIPMSVLSWEGAWDSLVRTADLIKPARTDFIIYGTAKRTETLEVVDDLDYVIGIVLQDSLITSSFGFVANPEDAYPKDETLGRAAAAAGAWNTDDVVEKYESGYVAGVNNDFSGDGSYNTRQTQMHFVNAIDSDIDVVRSLLWVPVDRVVTGAQEDLEFEEGELVELFDSTLLSVVGWDESAPQVHYVGVSSHPRLPFNIFNPQVEHPHTYVVLAFHTPEHPTNVDTGSETRLNAIKLAVDGGASTPLYLQGKSSGAQAEIKYIPNLYYTPDRDKYFWLSNIFQMDLLKDLVPRDAPSLLQSFYVPFGGISLADVEALGAPFDAAGALQRQVQQRVYDSALPLNEQVVPSFDPGLFTDFDLSAATQDTGPGPADKTNVFLRWGYTDIGEIATTPTDLTAFTLPASDYLENVWVGIVRGAQPGFHWSHGLKRSMTTQLPVPELASLYNGGLSLRVEGWYFIEPDPSNANPTDPLNPSSYSGTYPGSWLYLHKNGAWYPLTNVAFETGTAGGRTVLGADGSVQTSTGHVLTGDLPLGLPAGVYDVVVLHFYPWKTSTGAPTQVHAEFGYMNDAYDTASSNINSNEGVGVGVLGIDPVGV